MTAPIDQSKLLWNAPPSPARQAVAGELLFEFLCGHDRIRCELRPHGKWGVEAQFYRNEEFEVGRRFDTRELAEQWAHEERKAIEAVAG